MTSLSTLQRTLLATAGAIALSAGGGACAQVRSFEIDAQPARTAIPEFARQSGLQVLASGADVSEQRIVGVHGRMDVHAALHQLLVGTDLAIASDDGRTIALRAHIQPAQTPDDPVAPAPATQVQEVVVTGTAIGRSKLEAPYAITTFNQRQIDRDVPQSTVGLLRLVPGFSAEASGGEGGGQNLYVRGLPAGGWYYVQLQENGLTLFDEPQESFLNIDNLYRYDLMTDHVEVVRGGTSPIFANNAPGGTVNMIERSGSSTPHGAFRVTGGDQGLGRVDGFFSGPINDRVQYAVGGFYRQDDGLREPGYTANRGGQITARLSFLFDQGRLDVSAKYLNDKTIFYTALPLNDPRNVGVDLNGQLDQSYGTLDARDFATSTQRSFYGATPTSKTQNLRDGIHTDIAQLNSTFAYELGSFWQLTNRFGLLKGSVDYNALFSGASPKDATAYLAADLAKAKTGFGAQVSSVGYVLANQTANGARIAFNPAATGNLVLESGLYDVSTHIRTVTDDIRITRSFQSAVGHHDLAFGVYFDNFEFKQDRLQDTILTSLQSQPYALDVLAYNAAGQVVGSVTQDGFTRYGSAVARGVVDGYYLSGYASDQWRPVPQLGFDAGVRYTFLKDSGRDYQTGVMNLGDPTTLADDNAGGLTGAYTGKAQAKDTISWTAGTEYRLYPEVQLFARYTGAQRFARLQNIYLLQSNPVTKIQQAEGGIRTSGPLSFSAIGFYSHFNALGLSALVLNPITGTTQTLPLIGTTQTYGFEGDVNFRPIHQFGLVATVTAQNPLTENLVNLATGALGTAYNNKQLQQIPKLLLTVQPTAYLDLLGRPTEWSATIVHVGDRFVDYANTTKLPAYTTVDFSVLARITDRLDAQLQATNAFNSRGLTEGNPRTDILNGQGTPTAIYGRPVFGRLIQGSLTYHW